MRLLQESVALAGVSLRSLPSRLGPTSVTLVGVLIVVGVLASMLAVGEGVTSWSLANSRSDRMVILSHGAEFAAQSALPRDTVARIESLPGIKRGADGKPLMTASAMTRVEVIKATNRLASLVVVGLTNPKVYPELRIVEGRWSRPGLRELIVSPVAQRLYRGLQIGDRLAMRGGEWSIVGTFQSIGGAFDQVLFTDAETLLAANPDSNYRKVVAVLDRSSDFETLRSKLSADPTTPVSVYTEEASRLRSLGDLPRFVDFISYFVGGLLALGAFCAALSSLHTVVDTRRREIATLRAIGFGGLPVLISVLIEGLLIALVAALMGALIAWILFNGNVISMQERTFPMSVSVRVLGLSIALALLVGLGGALFPAIRAARQSVIAGLREI